MWQRSVTAKTTRRKGTALAVPSHPPHLTSGLPLPQRGRGVRGEGGLRAALTPALLPQGEGGPALRDRVRSSGATGLPIAVGVFSSASAFAPPPARRRFFGRLCAAAAEVWEFSLGEDNRVKLLLTMPHTRVPQGLKPFAMGSGDSRTARLKSLCEKWAERRLSG